MNINIQPDFYCFCSNASYKTILAKQTAIPLAFLQFLDKYTECTRGCGSCIEHLRDVLDEKGHLFE